MISFLKDECLDNRDTAHDLAHIMRVVQNARFLAQPDTDGQVIRAAAWLHDCVSLPKDHPDRKKSSVMAADKAAGFLKSIRYPKEKIPAVHHAIAAHSFSGGIKPETPEAKIVQDADRLDSLGAIGLARCLMVGGQLGRPLYNPDDPFCKNRPPDDSKWTIDHFYSKLFKLPETMQTETGKK
ncbi:MAG: HD domain-containing protein, partial [Balneolaceae bacterium]